jgi:5-methyltetrahydrofolate--homocysteine methyltransferase
MNAEELLTRIHTNVILGRVDKSDEGYDGDMIGQPGVSELVEEAVTNGVPVKRILSEVLPDAMEVVGHKYETKEYLVPDMLASAECVGTAMDILEPHLVGAGVETKGRCVIAAVEGDLHDIGKNIVATMIKGAGYEIIDLGTSVPADRIVEAVRDEQARFLGLSALLTTTMTKMPVVLEHLQAAGVRSDVSVLIGGAPVSAAFAEKIGADAYCRDAFEAVDTLERLRRERD